MKSNKENKRRKKITQALDEWTQRKEFRFFCLPFVSHSSSIRIFSYPFPLHIHCIYNLYKLVLLTRFHCANKKEKREKLSARCWCICGCAAKLAIIECIVVVACFSLLLSISCYYDHINNYFQQLCAFLSFICFFVSSISLRFPTFHFNRNCSVRICLSIFVGVVSLLAVFFQHFHFNE